MIRTAILLAYGLLLLFLALRSLRAQRLKERYVLLFLFTGMPFLILALWPNGIVVVSRLLSIEKPTLMVLALAGFLILMIMQLFSIVSVQERRIAALAQVVGLLMEKQRLTGRDAKGDGAATGDASMPTPPDAPPVEGGVLDADPHVDHETTDRP